MSGIEQQKNINFGAKTTGKILGGIYFTGNTLAGTILPGGFWVRIGAGNDIHPLFILMPIQPVSAPSSAGINDYFELENPAGPTRTQALWYRYGKRAVHYCSYSLTALLNIFGPIELRVRVSSINPVTGVVTLYPQSERIVSVDSLFVANIEHTFPLVAPTSDSFYIELDSADADNTGITIREAFLSVGE